MLLLVTNINLKFLMLKNKISNVIFLGFMELLLYNDFIISENAKLSLILIIYL